MIEAKSSKWKYWLIGITVFILLVVGAILLIVLLSAGDSGSKKHKCIAEQEHITFGSYFTDSKDESNYYTISTIAKVPGSAICDVVLEIEGKDGTKSTLKAKSSSTFSNEEKQYEAKSIFFEIPKSTAETSVKWHVKSDISEGNWHVFPSIERNNLNSKFIVVADMSTCTLSEPLYAKLKEMDSSNIDGFMHVGDFAYNVHSRKGKTGDEFFQEMSSRITSRIPYFVTPGNHEVKYSGKFFSYRFKMPGGGDPLDRASHWYSFDYKGVHWTSLNFDYIFNEALHPEKKQEAFNWLSYDLDRASKNPDVNFIVFYSHRPFYCQKLDSCDMFFLARPFEVLLRKYKVDVMISGHAHHYMRLHKNTDFELTDYRDGPLMIVNGIGGAIDEEEDLKSNGLEGPFAAVSYKKTAGYLIIESTSSTLSIEMRKATDDTVIDNYSLVRKRSNKKQVITS